MGKMVIYGTGVYGRRVFDCLKRKNTTIDIFLVTNKNDDIASIEGIPVYELSELEREQLSDANVIVAVDERYHSDIQQALKDYFGNTILKNIVFYSKKDIDKLYRDTHTFNTKNFLSSMEPVSRLFGNERGTPVDRYYIERYLEKESRQMDACGCTLEVGEDIYSRRFFPQCEHDVLDYSKGMDLTQKETLPKDKYDVFICTQVFHQIYDVKSAIEGAYYLLKKDGVMFATVCGNISKLARNDEYEHYWGFTKISIEMLVKDVFGEEVEIETYGNAAVATAFVQGVSLEEIDAALLDKKDTDFTICISITAKKDKH